MLPIDTYAENPFGQRNEYFLGALIGGLFARSAAKKAAKAAEEAAKVPVVTETSHTVDLLAMNAKAIEAGYNPMTLLNAGGLSAFTTTKNITTGQNAMAAAQAKAAVPSMGSVFAGALGGALDSLTSTVFQAAAPMSKDYFPPAPTRSMGMAEALGWKTLGNTPAGSRVSGAMQFASGMAGSPPKGLGSPVVPQQGERTVTNPYNKALVDPTVGDAEGHETRGGDIASSAAGAWIYYNDYLYNMTGTTNDQRSIDPNKSMFGGWFKEERQAANDAAALIRTSDVYKIITQGLSSVQNWAPNKKPQTAHQADGGSWMDFAPAMP